MTDRAVVDLADVRAADAGRVGPKMARLGQLAADGWRIPDGYAVTAGALDGWLPAGARDELNRMFAAPATGPGELAELASRARALVEAQPLPSWLADAVAAAHGRLAARTGRDAALRVAVRSSAVSEDGQAASFAGQYETYLGVSGVDDVLLHVRRCWASGFSAHALAYRRRFGGPAPARASDLAVGVLELVDARSAGVAFTLDPVTGDRGVCVVEGNWGFGESVVSGQVTPDHWTVDRASGRVLTARTGAKLTWAAANPADGRVVLSPLPGDLTGQACLSEEEVRYICERAVAIEAAAGGMPQDVEWAVARDLPFPGNVFFLQHRPETTWTGAPGDTGAPGEAGAPGETGAPSDSAAQGEADQPAFDPVQYALRNVFKVPGT
ncbi:MAG TPA: PEP/pyruvate-binding domain-containing protein [Trebonia sp.]